MSTTVKNLTSGTTLNLYMSQSGTSTSGVCP